MPAPSRTRVGRGVQQRVGATWRGEFAIVFRRDNRAKGIGLHLVHGKQGQVVNACKLCTSRTFREARTRTGVSDPECTHLTGTFRSRQALSREVCQQGRSIGVCSRSVGSARVWPPHGPATRATSSSPKLERGSSIDRGESVRRGRVRTTLRPIRTDVDSRKRLRLLTTESLDEDSRSTTSF